MDAAVRQFVRTRANNRCEYCRLPQSAAPFFTFHIEHIHSQQHVSDDSSDNLALACPDCNRRKGPNLTTLDPETRIVVPLFHPRRDRWEDHFEFQDAYIMGRSDIGCGTVRLLEMNGEERIEMRSQLLENGEF